MRDLTTGSIPRHIVALAAPMAIGLLVQTLYFLVDLYFVARLGDAAIAGVSLAGNAMFLVMALTQILSVGAVALVSHAAGRRDQAFANVAFNQTMLLAAVMAAATLVAGYTAANVYLARLGADAATVAAGRAYLNWFTPGLALQFVIAGMAAALRGTGVVKPTMIVQLLTVVVNIALAPVLIAGWGTGAPMGVAGAGLASTIASVLGVVLLTVYFIKLERYVRFAPGDAAPRADVLRRIIAIGFPAGGELILMFLYMAVIYGLIRDFGAPAQAGFGLGSRLMQAIFMPAMAIAFAAPAVAGQNFGARRADRVRATFRAALLMSCSVMAALMVLCQLRPDLLAHAFTDDPETAAVATRFLQIISWNFIATGVIFTCSGLFQALGNTWPALFSTATRLLTFAVPAVWIARQPGFALDHLWMLSVATVALQAVLSVTLVLREMRRRLRFERAPEAREGPAAAEAPKAPKAREAK